MIDTWMKILDIVNKYHMENHDYQSDEHNAEITAIAKAMQAHWIPLYDELPEKCSVVLITSDDGTVSESYYDYNGDWQKRAGYGGIRAWMPLPEPYKGTNDDNRNNAR